MKNQLTGIRIYSGKTFAESFECIFPFFNDLFFFEPPNDSCFRFPFDDDSVFENYRATSIANDKNNGMMFDADTLLALADFVSEDWNGISLLDTREFSPHKKFESQIFDLRQNNEIRFVDQKILCFYNFDGSFWQFFTNIDGVTDAMILNHRGNHGVDLRHVDIRVNYWNVGEYRDDFPIPVG